MLETCGSASQTLTRYVAELCLRRRCPHEFWLCFDVGSLSPSTIDEYSRDRFGGASWSLSYVVRDCVVRADVGRLAVRVGEWFCFWFESWTTIGLLLLGRKEVQRDLLLCETQPDGFAPIIARYEAGKCRLIWQAMLCQVGGQGDAARKQIVLRSKGLEVIETTRTGNVRLEFLRLPNGAGFNTGSCLSAASLSAN